MSVLTKILGVRTEYTVQTERSRLTVAIPNRIVAHHHVNYPDNAVAKTTKWGTITFSTPIWAGTVVEQYDGTVTAFLPIRQRPGTPPGQRINLGTFKTVQAGIEAVIDFSRAYREAGIELW